MDDQRVTQKQLVEALERQKQDLAQELSKQKQELMQEMGKLGETLQQSIRDSQTEVRKAFLPYQDAINTRIRAQEAKLSNVDAGLSERVAIVERRLWKLKRSC